MKNDRSASLRKRQYVNGLKRQIFAKLEHVEQSPHEYFGSELVRPLRIALRNGKLTDRCWQKIAERLLP